jgi:hypothetical protein
MFNGTVDNLTPYTGTSYSKNHANLNREQPSLQAKSELLGTEKLFYLTNDIALQWTALHDSRQHSTPLFQSAYESRATRFMSLCCS